MNLQETALILATLELNYPDTLTRGKGDGLKMARAKLWQKSFADIPYKVVEKVVYDHIKTDTGQFMPVIGVIFSKCIELAGKKAPTEMEAWNLVRAAICNSGYHSKEYFNRLPPMCQTIIGSPEALKDMALTPNLNMEVVGSNFMRSYKVALEAEKEREKLAVPQQVKNRLDELASKIVRKITA